MPNELVRPHPARAPASDDRPPATGAPASAINQPMNSATPTQNLAAVDDLLAETSFALKFPAKLENLFQAEIGDTRVKQSIKLGLVGTVLYDSFLVIDQFMLPDIMNLILIVQLAIVTPIMLAVLYGVHHRIWKPELALAFCQLVVLGSICLFYTQSRSDYAAFVIFTVPTVMAFGIVVLRLPFRLSLGYVLIAICGSTLAIFLRDGGDFTLIAFTILNTATVGLFMVFSTYHGEKSDRQTYLFNLRERFRADVLAEKNEQLRSLSEIDGLTGVANRRYFDGELEHLWQAAAHAAEPLALFFVDIDHFKKLNDTFGHQEGDHCLRAVAQCLQAHLMPNAILARYGGEEFVVLLPGVNELYAGSCAEVLRSAVSRLALTSDNGCPMIVSVSIGTATMIPNPAQRSATLVSAADQALYRAKENGRNRVERAAPLNDAGTRDLRQTA